MTDTATRPDVQAMIEAATPLPWRQSGTPEHPHWYISGPDTLVHGPWLQAYDDTVQETKDRWNADAALIVYAVNHLPQYEAVAAALEQVIADGEPYFEDGTPAFHPDDDSIRNARAALAALREEAAS